MQKLTILLVSLIILSGCVSSPNNAKITNLGNGYFSYVNEKEGLSLEYPSNWQAEIASDPDKEVYNILNINSSLGRFAVLIDKTYSFEERKSYYHNSIKNNPKAFDIEENDAIVSGNKAYMILRDEEADYGTLTHETIILEDKEKGHLIMFLYVTSPEIFEQSFAEFNSILNTLSLSSTQESGTQSNTEPKEPTSSNDIESKVLGEWRLRPIPNIPSSYTSFKLVLSKGVFGNTWQFSSSSGNWKMEDIVDSDWKKWGYEGYPYDIYGTKNATKKIILSSWIVNGEKMDVDAIIEEDSGEVTSIFVVAEFQMQFSRK